MYGLGVVNQVFKTITNRRQLTIVIIAKLIQEGEFKLRHEYTRSHIASKVMEYLDKNFETLKSDPSIKVELAISEITLQDTINESISDNTNRYYRCPKGSKPYDIFVKSGKYIRLYEPGDPIISRPNLESFKALHAEKLEGTDLKPLVRKKDKCIIISCSALKSKVLDKGEASDIYDGRVFKAFRDYFEDISEIFDVYILSSLYGYINLDDIINTYNFNYRFLEGSDVDAYVEYLGLGSDENMKFFGQYDDVNILMAPSKVTKALYKLGSDGITNVQDLTNIKVDVKVSSATYPVLKLIKFLKEYNINVSR